MGSFILDWLNGKSYVTVHTSGSTGTPKSIKVNKAHMVNSAKATAKHFNLPEKTTALLCLPAHYIAGKMMLVRAMVLGWRIDMAQPKTNPLDYVYRRYEFCAMTPLQLDNSLSRLHLLKKLIVGGGPISPSLYKRLQEVKTKIYETYGEHGQICGEHGQICGVCEQICEGCEQICGECEQICGRHGGQQILWRMFCEEHDGEKIHCEQIYGVRELIS